MDGEILILDRRHACQQLDAAVDNDGTVMLVSRLITGFVGPDPKPFHRIAEICADGDYALEVFVLKSDHYIGHNFNYAQCPITVLTRTRG